MKTKNKPTITPTQALNNFRLLTELSNKNTYAVYRGSVNEICEEVLSRGITDHSTPKLLAMLEHALAFIEHSHAHGDEPITEIDFVSTATDGGPEMECNLKGIRAAIAAAKQ